MDKSPSEAVDKQIENKKKTIDYDTRELTIEYIVDKYSKGAERGRNEIYVPDYQREFVWDLRRQSRFIESILLGLPIPLLFVAEMPNTGRLEIVDGSQRIRTLAAFYEDELKLTGLEKLDKLNGLAFSDLSIMRQRKFKNMALRMIVLSGEASPRTRNDMFDRINTSSLPLCPMETRKGLFKGDFTSFIYKCAKSSNFKRICPIWSHFKGRQEEAELVLRFFAFSDFFPNFSFKTTETYSIASLGVAKFLDAYLDYGNKNYSTDKMQGMRGNFQAMLEYVDKTFPDQGFGKTPNAKQTSRPYFEAIAVGTHLALIEKPNLKIISTDWATLDKNNPTEFFNLFQGKYHSHTPAKLKKRIEFVKNKLISYA